MYQKSILKSIIDNQDYLALTRLQGRQSIVFQDPDLLKLYNEISTLSAKYHQVPDSKFLTEFFKSEKVSKAKDAFHNLYKEAEIHISSNILGLIDQQLLYYVRKKSQSILKSYSNDFKLGNATDIPDILTDLTDDLNQVAKALESDLNTEGIMYHDPENEVNEIKQRLISDYDLRKSGTQGYYKFDTGIDQIDKTIGGIHSVEFLGILGFVKNGKSYLCRQIAYNVLCQGKNVVFISLEMSYESIQHSFLSLHANNVRAWGYDTPKIKTADIRAGTLSSKAEEFYKNQVIDDFTTSPDMGTLYIKQPSTSKYTPENLFSDIRNLKNTMDIDLLVIDYPGLMQPSSGRRDRESYNELFRVLRGFGLANHIPIIFPVQTNRAGFDNALKDKENLFSTDAIGDYSSIERECTNVISIITTQDMREAGQSQIQHLLSRESQLFSAFRINSDFETGIMSELKQLSQEDTEQLIQEIEI